VGNTREELLERYKTWMKIQRGNSKTTIKEMLYSTGQFLSWLTKEQIEFASIDQNVIDKYLAYCYDTLSQNSMVVITANLRKLCIHFLKINVKVKVAKPTAPNRDKISLTKNEITQMFRCASNNPLELAILKTLYYSGIRNSELTNLDIEDIDFDHLQIHIKHGKGNKARTVNMTNDCGLTLQKWLKARPIPKDGYNQAVFISSNRQRITTTTVLKIVKRVAARAGIQRNVYPHKLRITHITHMAEAGLSISEIQAQSGHSNTQTLLGYIQHTPSRIRKGYDKTFLDMDDKMVNIETENMFIQKNGRYKKIAIQKYLDGEIDTTALHSILTTLDKPRNEPKNIDQAYQ